MLRCNPLAAEDPAGRADPLQFLRAVESVSRGRGVPRSHGPAEPRVNQRWLTQSYRPHCSLGEGRSLRKFLSWAKLQSAVAASLPISRRPPRVALRGDQCRHAVVCSTGRSRRAAVADHARPSPGLPSHRSDPTPPADRNASTTTVEPDRSLTRRQGARRASGSVPVRTDRSSRGPNESAPSSMRRPRRHGSTGLTCACRNAAGAPAQPGGTGERTNEPEAPWAGDGVGGRPRERERGIAVAP